MVARAPRRAHQGERRVDGRVELRLALDARRHQTPGVESHEDPYIVSGNGEPLEPGFAFSVEPGIYLPGAHGARIEDIVVCTESGADRLNVTTRELVVV